MLSFLRATTLIKQQQNIDIFLNIAFNTDFFKYINIAKFEK